MATYTLVTPEMALAAICESKGDKILCVTRDGTRIVTTAVHPPIERDKPALYAVTLKLDGIHFERRFLSQRSVLRSFAHHTAQVINVTLAMPSIRKSEFAVCSPGNRPFSPPKAPTAFWWLSGNSEPPSAREVRLMNAAIKLEYGLRFGIPLAGKSPRILKYASRRHLRAEIERVHGRGEAIFVSEDAVLPPALIVDGLYLLRGERAYHVESGRTILVWPVPM